MHVLNNPNIMVSGLGRLNPTYVCKYECNNNTFISIEPYDRELTLNYVEYWLIKILRFLNEECLTPFDTVIKIDGYAINGLYESNFLLLWGFDIEIVEIDTNKYRTIKSNQT